MTQIIERAIPQIQTRLQAAAPLLWDVNVSGADRNINQQLHGLFAAEVLESLRAREEYESENDPEKRSELLGKLADEHNDMLVFLASIIALSHRELPEQPTLRYSVNGDGGYSTIYDRLQTLAPELEDGRAVMQAIALLKSADFHLPVPNAAINTLNQTLDKVAANNPRVFMSLEGFNQSELSSEERSAKLTFVRKAMRMIRDHVNQREGERPLKESDWTHLRSVIEFGYEHPHAALQAIYSYLTSSSREAILSPEPLPAKYVIRSL